MGIFSKKIKEPVEGTVRIVACSAQSTEDLAAFKQGCRINGVVEAPGLAPTPVERHLWVPGEKHPRPGMVLPATIDRSKPARFDVHWDQIPTHRQRAWQATQAAAASADGVPDGSGSVEDQLRAAFPGATIEVQGADAGDLPPEALAAIQAALGGGSPAGRPTATSDPDPAAGPQVPAAGDDRLSRLERLAELHQAGVLTDAELAAEKQRILAEPD